MKKFPIFIISIITLLAGCIKDDFIDDLVDPQLSITTIVDSIGIDTEFQFQSQYLNNIGQIEEADLKWSSSDINIIDIDNDGLATAIAEGSSYITVSYLVKEVLLTDSILVQVGTETVFTEQVINTTIVTTSSYLLQGTLEVTEQENGIKLNIDEDYKASTALPGFYLYLSNNRNSISNALEVAKVSVFNGAHSYIIPNTLIGDYNYLVYYCKPFNIKVGEAKLN